MSAKNEAAMATEVQIPADCFIMCALSGGVVVTGLPISHISTWSPWNDGVTIPITQQIVSQLWEPGGQVRCFRQI